MKKPADWSISNEVGNSLMERSFVPRHRVKTACFGGSGKFFFF